MCRATFARGDPTNHLRAISKRLLRVKSAGGTGHTLCNDLGILIDEDAHMRLLKKGVRLIQRRVDCLTCNEQFFHCVDANSEVGFGFVIKGNFDDLFNAACTDHNGYADI